ncbi:MAG: hypothetical protein JNM81_15445 [Rhodospirillaceae bacterium]|nr:hypothetical protein [Rhodospirillaceae bacterium]
MIKYQPIDCPKLKSSHSTLIDFQWHRKAVELKFTYPKDDQRILQVNFDRAEIVRILDEFPLSTEEDKRHTTGLIVDHLAYLVEESPFYLQQSTVWRDQSKDVRHFRFVTGAYCADVMSRSDPRFCVLDNLESSL